jgi:hypothetical protein
MLTLVEVVLILFIFFAFAIRTESFQTFLGKKASQLLSKRLDNEVTIEKVDIAFFDHVFLEEFYVSDQRKDTLMHFHELELDFDLYNFSFAELDFPVDYLRLDHPTFNLRKYHGEEFSNLQFVLDVFKTEEDEEKEPVDFQINVNQFDIVEAKFEFSDWNKPKKFFGIDFAHLNIAHLNLKASSVKINNSVYNADIKLLSLQDHSGFVLNQLSADAQFSKDGLTMDKLKILTPFSTIDIPTFAMLTRDLSSYKEFLDQVDLNFTLSQSKASFRDIVYFAPMLKGMKDAVQIEAKTIGKIANWNVNDLDIEFGADSRVKGDFILPDFRKDTIDFNQKIAYLFLTMNDVNRFSLPDQVKGSFEIPGEVERLAFIESKNIALKGDLSDMTIEMGQLRSAAGELIFNESIHLLNLVNELPLNIRPFKNNKQFVTLRDFDLARVLANPILNKVTGRFTFDLLVDGSKNVKVKDFSGLFNRFDFADYSYNNILISTMDFGVDLTRSTPQTTINGKAYVRDQNLDLEYRGMMSFGNFLDVDAYVDLQCAHLNDVHPVLDGRGELHTEMHFTGNGKSKEDLTFVADIDNLFYEENGQDFKFDHLDLQVHRENGDDLFEVNSNLISARVEGYADFENIVDNILYQSAQVFPALFTDLEPTFDPKSNLSYDFDIISINELLNIFYPELQIANNSSITGKYDGAENRFDLTLNSDYITYDNYYLDDIYLFQELDEGQLLAFYRTGNLKVNDSLLLTTIRTTNIAANGFMDSQLIFDDKKGYRSNLQWNTNIFESNGFDIDILPSFFTVNDHRWDLKNKAHVNFSGDCFLIEDFLLERKNQTIEIYGQLSKVPDDKLNLSILNLDLSDVSTLLFTDEKMTGRANVAGSIQEPFSDLKFSGQSFIRDLVVDGRSVGDIGFDAYYNTENKAIEMAGELMFQRQRTFDFNGEYAFQEESPLNFTLNFNNTDLGVVNAFMDPQVVSGIEGKLEGKFNLTGSFKEPAVTGKIDLDEGMFNLTLLGADFEYSGDIESDEYGVYINAMPISDEDGNTGFLTGHLFHDYFTNFLYEIAFDFENHPFEKDPNNPLLPKKLDRFKVMKTRYEEDVLYYGDAYVTGRAFVSGYQDKMSIDVDAKTQKGTWINFPMYGPATVSEDGFIRFKSPDEDSLKEDSPIDFSGVNLGLNFDITPDAKVKLIFDENVNDEITAYGKGDLSVNLDKYGDVALNGTYTVTDGVYNFVMGPYKQNFFIAEGGTVQWNGSPYDAILDLETYYKTNANLSVVMGDVVTQRATEQEEIRSILRLKGDMSKPDISFDLAAPKASESGKAVINRIKSDQDELNRQFFSLLIWRRFQPLAGQGDRGGAGGGAAYDLVSTQISSLLSQVSDDVDLNFAMASDEMTGESSVEFGFQKELLNDRLIVSGAFGVGGYEATGQNHVIGDVNIEYLLNDKGTFRANVFNESNANSIVHAVGGQYTQGIGINYQEEFYSIKDFQAFKEFLNLFRSYDNKQINEDRYEPIPDKYLKNYESKP